MKKVRKLFTLLIAVFAFVLSGCSFLDLFNKVNKPQIVLENNNIELNLFENTDNKYQLRPTVKNGSGLLTYSFKYLTNDRSIASVSNTGLITANSVGETVVTISLNEDTSIKTKCNVKVINEKRVKVQFSETNVNVPIGQSYQINATVYNADNYSLNWESSNPNKVSVSSSGLVTVSENASSGDVVTITATSVEDDSKYTSCKITVDPKPLYNYDYTLMYYMCGSTLEGEEGCFSEDIKEILATNYPSRVKILIETGGSKKWFLSKTYLSGADKISTTSLQRWEVENKKLKLVSTLDTNRMATESSFESFLKWGLDNYQATQMGIVISGHGGGIAGCALDDNYVDRYNYPNSLNNAEVASACKNALSQSNRNKFTWIGYDCCLMQGADTASVNADYFDYMVASQESEYGYGWDHDVYLPLIASNPKISPENLFPTLIDSFVEQYHKYCKTSYLDYEACYQTLSALNLKKMPDFVNAFNTYFGQIGNSYSNYVSIKNAFKNSYNNFGEGDYGLADFKNFMENMATSFSTIPVGDVLDALDELVISNSYCSEYKKTCEVCGLNVFLPVATYQTLQPAKSDYEGELATKFTEWQEMCLQRGSWYY